MNKESIEDMDENKHHPEPLFKVEDKVSSNKIILQVLPLYDMHDNLIDFAYNVHTRCKKSDFSSEKFYTEDEVYKIARLQ